ncbi:MAG: outer membrane protein transport protein [Bacteroidetes bacterium]|nr:outer membrane protein transport protein [Bacteroidota bacterium]
MKTYRIYWMAVLSIIGLQLMQAQYVEDVLRFSQFGSSVGARSQSMGNTVVGIADDYSALFGNPAGLSQQKSFEFSVGLSRLGYENSLNYLGVKTTDNEDVINLNNLGIVYPIPTSRGGLTFAFGFGRVANFTSIASFDAFNASNSLVESDGLANSDMLYELWLADTLWNPILAGNVQQTCRILESGGLNHWSFGGGIDIAKSLSVGVTLNFVSGSYSYDREFTEIDTRNLYRIYPEDFSEWTYTNTIASDISGFNAVFGLMFQKPDKFRIGATVKTPTVYDISETFSDDGVSIFDNGETFKFPDPGETEYKITTPLVISGGISFRPADWLLLAGDAEYTDWTEMEFDSNNPDLIQENRNIIKLMRDTWNLRGGAEVSIWEIGLMLRAGIEWKPSPWKNDPPEYDQMMYTAGIGYLLDEGSSINLSYAIGSWDTFRNNYYLSNGMTSTTNESISTNTINITFSHKF